MTSIATTVIFSEHFGENRMILLQTVVKWRCNKLCAFFLDHSVVEKECFQVMFECHKDLSLLVLSDLTHVSSSFPASPLSPSITPHFHPRLKNSSFPQIFSSIVLLPFHPPDWLHGLQLFFRFFSGMSVLTLALCARLSWILVSF